MKKCRFCNAELQESTEYEIFTSVKNYKCPICKAEWQTHIIQTAKPKEVKFPKYAAPVPKVGEMIYVNREAIKMSRVTDVFPNTSGGGAVHYVKVKDLPCHSFNWKYLSMEQKYFRRGH